MYMYFYTKNMCKVLKNWQKIVQLLDSGPIRFASNCWNRGGDPHRGVDIIVVGYHRLMKNPVQIRAE